MIDDPTANQFATGNTKRKERRGKTVELRENLRSMPIDGQFDMWSQVWTKVATDGMGWNGMGGGGRRGVA